MLTSVFSYVTWDGTFTVNPACESSNVFTDTPGMVIPFAKNMVRGHLLNTISNWELTMGWDWLRAVRNV